MFGFNKYDDGVLRVWVHESATGVLWGIQYVPGARLADIICAGHAVDCVQVRDWDWSEGPTGQLSRVPDARDLGPVLQAYIVENSAALLTSP